MQNKAKPELSHQEVKARLSKEAKAKVEIGLELYEDILLFTEYAVPHRKIVDGVYYHTPFFHEEIRHACRLDNE